MGLRIFLNQKLNIFGVIFYLFTCSFSSAMTLKQAVVSAVKTNPSGDAARAHQRSVGSELDQAKGRFLPEVTLYGDVGKHKVRNPNSLSDSDNLKWHLEKQIGVRASLSLFDGYERANALYRAAARLDKILYDLFATTETLALNAVEAYIDVYRHRQLLYIARKNIQRHKQILNQIRQRIAGGKAPRSDGIQIQERLYAAQAVLIEIEKAAADANAKFRRVIGKSPKGKMKLRSARRLPRSKTALVESALANNYDIKAALKAIAENQYSAKEAQSDLFPKLSLESNASVGANRSGSEGPEADLYVGLKLTWKLYDGGVVNSRANALAEQAYQAGYTRDVKIREVAEAAEKAWNSYYHDRNRNNVLSSQVKSHDSIVRDYSEEYKLAKRSLLDVLDAERGRFNAKFQQISVSAAYLYASYRMLAVQSKLAAYFGVAEVDVAAQPYYEEQYTTKSSRQIFNFKLPPLNQ